MLKYEKIIEELNKIGIRPPKIIYYDETDSTNTRAKEYAESEAGRESVVFIANSQTAGRGRRGRSFVSNKDAGIYLSILTYPTERGFDVTKITAEASVALCRAIEALTDCEIKIKWVNDLYLGGKKIAGILTEGKIENDGKIAYSVVGMGINVYKKAISDEMSGIATSLESELNDAPDRSKLVAMIIKEFFSTDDCYEEYKSRSVVIGQNVTVIKPTESYTAKVLDINPDYSLELDVDGKAEKLFTGEVSVKL